MTRRLDLTRLQILAFRRHVGALDERLSRGRHSLRRAAWAGLQDSMPRAALLSIHARVEGTEPSTWEDPSLVQLWGPRFNVFVVAARDLAVFSLGTLSDDGKGRQRAEELAARLSAVLGGARMSYGEAGRALGVHPNSLRYAAATGTVLIRWEGARLPTVWTVPPPEVDPRDARLELARRYLHIYGPATPAAFSRWAGVGLRDGLATFEALRRSLTPVHTPVGGAWILTRDEATFRAGAARSGRGRSGVPAATRRRGTDRPPLGRLRLGSTAQDGPRNIRSCRRPGSTGPPAAGKFWSGDVLPVAAKIHLQRLPTTAGLSRNVSAHGHADPPLCVFGTSGHGGLLRTRMANLSRLLGVAAPALWRFRRNGNAATARSIRSCGS